MAKTTKGAAKTVQVRISARETVYYQQTVRMTREELRQLRALLADESVGDDEINGEVEGWIDRSDVCDGEGLTDVELEEVK